MKLTRISAQQFGVFNELDLKQFGRGLNVILGADNTVKSTFRNLLRGMIFGFDTSYGWTDAIGPKSHGCMEVFDGANRFRISRNVFKDIDISRARSSSVGTGHVVVQRYKSNFANTAAYEQGYDQLVPENPSCIEDLCRVVSLKSYDAFFDVGFRDSICNAEKITQQFKNGFDWKDSKWPFEVDYWHWKREADARQQRLENTSSEIKELQSKKRKAQSELENVRIWRDRIENLNEQISKIEFDIHTFESRSDELIRLIEDCDHKIEALRVRIDELNSRRKRVPAKSSIENTVEKLYRRLDKIDDQIKRWNAVQNDVQTQRMKLRDKMVAWANSTVDLNEYPFGEAQQKISDLETKISQVKKHAVQWIGETPAEMKSNDFPNKVKSLCEQMNDDVYALCNELGTLQAYIQRRSAVVELKQLRRCYAELNENIKRLFEQRRKTIAELKDLDPDGVAAVERAELKFCQCAEHEGYLTARKRFVDHALIENSDWTYEIDSSEDRKQLELLLGKRQDLIDEYNKVDRDLLDIRADHEEFIEERNNTSALGDEHDLLIQIERIDGKIRSLIELKKELQHKVDSDARWYDYRPNNVLVNSSKWLKRLSNGRWDQIWIDELTQMPVATQTDRNHVNFANLKHLDQDLVTLSLLIAGVEGFATNGVRIPLLLDDVLLNHDHDQVTTTLNVLGELCSHNHQVIVLAQTHQHSRNLFNSRNITVQELPDTTIVPRTFDNPDDWREPDAKPFARRSFGSQLDRENRSWDWIAKSIEDAEPLHENASLESIGLISFDEARVLQKAGIETIADLLHWNVKDSANGRLASIGEAKIQNWQDQANLLLTIPGLRVIDARILTGCYIYNPVEIDNMTAEEIRDRVGKFLNSDSGKHYAVIIGDFDLRRISAWKRSMQRTRNSWTRRSTSRLNRPATSNPINVRANGRAIESQSRNQTVRLHKEPLEEIKDIQIRFYLDLDDEVEQAPSIGPKTAERLAKAGVIKVSDLLKYDADEIVAKVEYKRIKADHVRDWQKQSELVCSIPNLRGHDAQMLVACGITSAGQLANMDAKTVLGLVEPFSKTKEGIKLLRTNKRPDLAEVTDWINWAKHKRSVVAA